MNANSELNASSRMAVKRQRLLIRMRIKHVGKSMLTAREAIMIFAEQQACLALSSLPNGHQNEREKKFP
jgi:hypothetical protein